MCAVREAMSLQTRQHSSYQSDLKTILADLLPSKQAEVKEFRSQHGSKVVGEVTVDMVSSMHRKNLALKFFPLRN